MPLTEAEELELLELEEEDAKESDPAAPRISTGEAAARGAGQGMFGLGDEMEATAGNLEGGLRKLGTRVGLADESDPQVVDYMNRLQGARDRNDLAQKQHPLAYGGAKLATTGASMVGGGLPGLVAKGALTAYGASDSDNLATQAGESALGGVLAGGVGKAVGLAGQVAAPAVGLAGKGLEQVTPQIAQTAARTALTGLGGVVGGAPGAAAGYVARNAIPKAVGRAGSAFAQEAGKATTELGMKLAEKGFAGPVADRIAQTAAGQMLLNAAPDKVIPNHYILYNQDENYRKAVNGEE